ncbi:hypothetical protein Q8F55_004692 [Vanrija albida]|uniref:Uncharacterized protein n=1 Tax=Vanrija albida TaxID=181172 RepID=A0ABR3Q8K1_9TREE
MRLATLVLLASLVASVSAAPVAAAPGSSASPGVLLSSAPASITHVVSATHAVQATHTHSRRPSPTANTPRIPPPPGQANLRSVGCLTDYEQYLPPIVGAGFFAIAGLIGLLTT